MDTYLKSGISCVMIKLVEGKVLVLLGLQNIATDWKHWDNEHTPIGDSIMYIGTSSNNSGDEDVFCSFEQIDVMQISSISFFYNRYSAENVHKLTGRFRVQVLLSDNTWSTRYNIPKNGMYRASSTQWTSVS